MSIDGRDVPCAIVDGGAPVAEAVPAAVATLDLPASCPVVVVVGGAGGMVADDRARAVVDQVVVAAVAADATIVHGGTDAGVMRLIGDAVTARGGGVRVVGVSAIGTVHVPGLEQHASRADAASLEPNLTHLVLAPGSSWGDESPVIAAVADALAATSPSVTVLVNGGDIAYADVTHSLHHEREVVVVAGSGRTADALAAAVGGAAVEDCPVDVDPADTGGGGSGEPLDGRAVEIARRGGVRVVDADGDIRAVLDEALGTRSVG